MSLQDILLTGSSARSWTRLDVQSINAVDAIISNDLSVAGNFDVVGTVDFLNDVVVEGNLEVGRVGVPADLLVHGNLQVNEDIYTPLSIRIHTNDSAHAIDYCRFLQTLPVAIVNCTDARVYYQKIGRQVTMTFNSEDNDGVFTATGAIAAQPFSLFGLNMENQLKFDSLYNAAVASGNLTVLIPGNAATGNVVRFVLNFSTSTFSFVHLDGTPMGANLFYNFSFSFIAAQAGQAP